MSRLVRWEDQTAMREIHLGRYSRPGGNQHDGALLLPAIALQDACRRRRKVLVMMSAVQRNYLWFHAVIQEVDATKSEARAAVVLVTVDPPPPLHVPVSAALNPAALCAL